MSAKSIRAFQQAHPHRAPSLQDRLEAEAKALRESAAKLLSQASRIDAMVAALKGEP